MRFIALNNESHKWLHYNEYFIVKKTEGKVPSAISFYTYIGK